MYDDRIGKLGLKMRNFYRIYGKYMNTIEIVLIFAAASVFLAQIFFLEFGALTAGPSLVAFMIAAVVHAVICIRIAKLELFPYKTVRLDSLNSYFYWALLFSSLVGFALVFLLALIPEFWGSNLLAESVAYYAITAVKVFIAFFPFSMSWLNNRSKSRLSFRTVLVGLKLISKEDKKVRKKRLIEKYIKWFREGLYSCNRYVFEGMSAHVEIVGIDDYYRSVCCIAVIGEQAERDIIAEQIRLALDSMGGRHRKADLRRFLIGLKNMKNIERNTEYPLSELNEMIRILSFSERVKERLKSPYFTALIGSIPILLAVLPFVWK